MGADADVAGERAEPFHTMRTVVGEVALTLQRSRLIEKPWNWAAAAAQTSTVGLYRAVTDYADKCRS